MSNYDLDPLPSLTLTDEAQIRAYVNPTRLTILALLAQEKQAVTDVARQMGVHPANITHHFKLLEKVGLIKLVEKRETGKNLKKFYRAVAYHFSVAPAAESTNQSALALTILRDNLTAALTHLTSQPAERPVLGLLKTIAVKADDLEAFGQKLLDLAAEYETLAAPGGMVYTLNLSLYPDQAAGHGRQEVTLSSEN